LSNGPRPEAIKSRDPPQAGPGYVRFAWNPPGRAVNTPPVQRAAPILAPVVALSLVLGCPRDHSATVDAAPSASISASATASPSASWPKTLPVPEPPPEDFSELDAEVDAESDATFDATTDADASDASDARAKADAYDDAPLLGAKTYPDENPMRGIRKITSAAAKVHKVPKDNNIIALLPKGTEISLVAEIMDWYRVRYSDPNTGVRRQGWIYITTVAGPRMKTCPTNWTHHDQDGGWCDRECTKNTDCKALKGYKCSGTLCFYAGE